MVYLQRYSCHECCSATSESHLNGDHDNALSHLILLCDAHECEQSDLLHQHCFIHMQLLVHE